MVRRGSRVQLSSSAPENFMKRLIPRNPNYNSPDRKAIVTQRVLMSLGGIAVCGLSIASIKYIKPLSGDRDILIFPSIIGIFSVVCSVASEIQERLQNNNNGEEEGGGGGWDWRGPDDPDLPNSPNGSGLDLISQIEEYLQEQAPVTV